MLTYPPKKPPNPAGQAGLHPSSHPAWGETPPVPAGSEEHLHAEKRNKLPVTRRRCAPAPPASSPQRAGPGRGRRLPPAPSAPSPGGHKRRRRRGRAGSGGAAAMKSPQAERPASHGGWRGAARSTLAVRGARRLLQPLLSSSLPPSRLRPSPRGAAGGGGRLGGGAGRVRGGAGGLRLPRRPAPLPLRRAPGAHEAEEQRQHQRPQRLGE